MSSKTENEKNFNAVHYSAAPTSDKTDADAETDETDEPTMVFMSNPNESTDNLGGFKSQKETTEKYLPLPPVMTSTTPTDYSPVPNFKVLRPPDKSRRSCCQKLSLYSCLVGFVFIIASVIW